MQTDEKEKIIMEHVLDLDNEENLEMALDIISTPIREQIIKTFLKELKDFINKFICKKLDMWQWDWKTELCDKPYGGNKYRSFGVSSKFGVLQEPISISLSGNITGNELYIVVCSPSTNESFNESLRQRLNDELRPGTYWDNWKGIWSQSLQSPNCWNYQDWTHKYTLIKMHTDPCRVVEDIGNYLLRIINVAKFEIEEWVKQNSSAP